MNLQTLRSFVEVYRCGSISDAARALGLTQPAVSQHVAALEGQVGRPLFDRLARGMAPTPLAHDLAQQIGDGLDRAEAALATIRARSSRLTGTVHIAGPAELMAARIMPHLSVLWNAGLHVRMQFGGRSALYDMLLRARVDLAFTASRPDDPQLDGIKIGSERLLLVAAPTLAETLAEARDLAAALQRAPFVTYDSNHPLIRTWCAANGIDLGPVLPVVTAPDIRALRACAAAGGGWSVIPDYLCARALEDRSLVEIPAPVTTPEEALYLVWLRGALRHPRVAFARRALLDSLSDM